MQLNKDQLELLYNILCEKIQSMDMSQKDIQVDLMQIMDKVEQEFLSE